MNGLQLGTSWTFGYQYSMVAQTLRNAGPIPAIITSYHLVEITEWHKKLGGGASIAAAVIDRALSGHYRLFLEGDSLRLTSGLTNSD